MIILLEGIDNVGKSTLIKELKEKYDNIKSFAFPTTDIRKITEDLYNKFDRENLDDLLEYHLLFIEDFLKHQKDLKNDNNTVLLLDRYFYSNIAYFRYDLINYILDKGIPILEGVKFIRIVNDILSSFYRLLIQPDIVIYLEGISQSMNFLTWDYELGFKRLLPPKRLEVVKALQNDTFEIVESIINDYR